MDKLDKLLREFKQLLTDRELDDEIEWSHDRISISPEAVEQFAQTCNHIESELVLTPDGVRRKCIFCGHVLR